jgi:hypothetical protein
LDPVDCIDLSRTPHRLDPDDPVEIELSSWLKEDFVLSRAGIGDRRIFRVSRQKRTVVVRNDIYKTLLWKGLTGLRFLDVLTVKGSTI